jgi:hypothetical protein
LVNFESLLFFVLILRLKQLLILDKLLLHQQIVFDSVLTEKTQSAFGTWCDVWQLRWSINGLLLFLSCSLGSGLMLSLLCKPKFSKMVTYTLLDDARAPSGVLLLCGLFLGLLVLPDRLAYFP